MLRDKGELARSSPRGTTCAECLGTSWKGASLDERTPAAGDRDGAIAEIRAECTGETLPQALTHCQTVLSLARRGPLIALYPRQEPLCRAIDRIAVQLEFRTEAQGKLSFPHAGQRASSLARLATPWSGEKERDLLDPPATGSRTSLKRSNLR